MHELAYVFKTIWFGSDRYLTLRLARNRRSMFADMEQIQNVNTEMKPNMQAMTLEDSVKISKIIIW